MRVQTGRRGCRETRQEEVTGGVYPERSRITVGSAWVPRRNRRSGSTFPGGTRSAGSASSGKMSLSRPYETDTKRSRFSLQALLEPFAFPFSILFCFEWLRDRDVLDASSFVDHPMSAGLHERYITRGWVAGVNFSRVRYQLST